MPKTYRCPLCGKDHTYKDTCPIISLRMEAYSKKKSKDKIFIMGNIILACLEQHVNFRQVLCEIDVLESVLLDYTITSYHDVDLITDYFSAALNIPKRRFFKTSDETLKGLMKYLKYAYNSDYKKDKSGNIVEITLDVYLSDNVMEIPDIGELYILKEKQDRSWQYSLVYYPYSFNSCIELGNNTTKFNFLSMKTSGIVLAEDNSGLLKQFFEDNCPLLWKDTAQQLEFDDARFKKWTKLLVQQTKNNRIKWSLHTSFNGKQIYTTYLGNNEIRLSTNNNAASTATSYYLFNESLYIRDGEWGGISFGAAKTKNINSLLIHKNKNPKSTSNPVLLRLEELAKENISSFSDHSPVEKAIEKKLTYADCIVICRSLICHKDGHRIQPYKGIVPLLTEDSRIIMYEVYVGYCKSCSRYLIFQDDYAEMRKTGTPLCRIIEEETDESDNAGIRFKYKSESILYAMGYTVNAKDSLSANERQKILDNCINSGLLQVNDIMEFLNWLIVTRSLLPQNERAVGLWREDMSYLEKKYATEKIKIATIRAHKTRSKDIHPAG